MVQNHLISNTYLYAFAVHLEEAQNIFGESGVTITTKDERHMGAAIGSEEFKRQYVEKKISKWVEDIETLAKIAEDEPQSVYASYTKAISHRWTYIQRTVPDIAPLFEPLEKAIRGKLIPAIVGRSISDMERKIFALPVRLGGMGIYDPTTTADAEFMASSRITRNLTDIIHRQEKDLQNYDKEGVSTTIKEIKAEKVEGQLQQLNEVLELTDGKTTRILQLLQEKSAGLWLTARPIKSLDYDMNKQMFRDALCIRYGWRVPGTPSHCQCGKKNDIDHALQCAKGGYVIMRHNRLRDLEAELMREVCTDVQIEPRLLPIANENPVNGNSSEGARLDVSGNGIWSPMEKTFLDVRVLHPNCASYIHKDIAQLFKEHEQGKKATYNTRIIQVEKGSFTPLVFSTLGGMGKEAERYHKRLGQLIAQKRNELYSDVVNFIRTRLSICLMKSILISLRGVRGKMTKDTNTPISSLSFNLIQFDD